MLPSTGERVGGPEAAPTSPRFTLNARGSAWCSVSLSNTPEDLDEVSRAARQPNRPLAGAERCPGLSHPLKPDCSSSQRTAGGGGLARSWGPAGFEHDTSPSFRAGTQDCAASRSHLSIHIAQLVAEASSCPRATQQKVGSLQLPSLPRPHEIHPCGLKKPLGCALGACLLQH